MSENQAASAVECRKLRPGIRTSVHRLVIRRGLTGVIGASPPERGRTAGTLPCSGDVGPDRRTKITPAPTRPRGISQEAIVRSCASRAGRGPGWRRRRGRPSRRPLVAIPGAISSITADAVRRTTAGQTGSAMPAAHRGADDANTIRTIGAWVSRGASDSDQPRHLRPPPRSRSSSPLGASDTLLRYCDPRVAKTGRHPAHRGREVVSRRIRPRELVGATATAVRPMERRLLRTGAVL